MSRNYNSLADSYANILYETKFLADTKHEITVLNKKFIIRPQVFHPDITPDVKEYINGEVLKITEEEIEKSIGDYFDFLEVGCGAGYTSILAALMSKKCRVWATDINEAAIANTKENSKHHKVEDRVTAVVADVFDSEEIINRKYDMIYWNMPSEWYSVDLQEDSDPVLKSFIDPDHRGFRRYLSEARNILKPGGRLLVVFSFNLGSMERFRNITDKAKWTFNICANRHFKNEFDVNIIEFIDNTC